MLVYVEVCSIVITLSILNHNNLHFSLLLLKLVYSKIGNLRCIYAARKKKERDRAIEAFWLIIVLV